MCDGAVAILGELGKFISMSAQRVAGVSETCGDSELVRVSLLGYVGEVVNISFALLLRPGATVVEASCKIGANREAALSVGRDGKWGCD